MRSKVCLATVALLLLVAASPLWAQEQAPPPETPDVTAYRAIHTVLTIDKLPQKAEELGEAFLADKRSELQSSIYRKDVYFMMLSQYTQDKNWEKLVVLAEKFLAEKSADLVDHPSRDKVYLTLIDRYNQDKNWAKLSPLAEEFLAETRNPFVESPARDDVFLILFDSYKQVKNWEKVLDTVDRVEKLVPKTPAENSTAPFDRVRLYTQAMAIAANQIQNFNRAVDYAKRIKGINPNNADALLTIASVIPPLPTDPAALDATFEEIIENGRRFLAIDKPAALSEDQWKAIRKSIQIQTQRYVAVRQLNKKDYVECVKAYEELLPMTTPMVADDLYRLGFCYNSQATPAYNVAFTANEKSIAFTKDCDEAANAAYNRLVAFIEACNKTLSCDTDENKAARADLAAKQAEADCDAPANKAKLAELDGQWNVLFKAFEQKRDKAMDALAKSVAIGGAGAEAARGLLERMWTQFMAKAPYTLDEFVAMKKKELGVG